LQAPLKAGDKCLAQSGSDKQWYRATVERAYAADPVRGGAVQQACVCFEIHLCIHRLCCHACTLLVAALLPSAGMPAYLPPLPCLPACLWPARARLQTAPKYDVLFMDFGNKEHVVAAQV
jgi:hypothetical protein